MAKRKAKSAKQSLDESTAESSRSSGSSRRRQPHQQIKLTTNIQFDANQDAFRDIRRLLELFHEYSIPGPLLLRTTNDFSTEVGSGGQGQVRAASNDYLQSLQHLSTDGHEGYGAWPPYPALQQSISQWRTCVIKQLRSKSKKLENEAASAVREVLSLCQATKFSKRNDYIVKLLGWGICLDALESGDLSRSKLPFLVLERAMCDMEQFIVDGKQNHLSINEKFRIALEIGIGLLAVHTANMAHGDMKPSNILIFSHRNKGWSVKICDFGSASDATHHTLRGSYAGTDTWRPPETLSNTDPVDLQACDIFAYGLVLWSWFLGLPSSPIDGLEASQILKNVGRQQFYRRALVDIVDRLGNQADRKWLETSSLLSQTHPDSTPGSSRQNQSTYSFRIRWLANSSDVHDLFRNFESPYLNEILNTLSASLDELPHRRSRKPWDHLRSVAISKAPRPPAAFPARNYSGMIAHNDQSQQTWTGRAATQVTRYTIKRPQRSAKLLWRWFSFQLEHCAFVLTGSRYRFALFRQFHHVFSDVLGGNPDKTAILKHDSHNVCHQLSASDLKTLRKLISREDFMKIGDRSLHTFTFIFTDTNAVTPVAQWSQITLYSLARIRSRFADPMCWQELFRSDPSLANAIDQALAGVRTSACGRALVWSFRNMTALDIPEAYHKEYFAFLDDGSISDEYRTFRLHLLLERGFFLGQSFSDEPDAPTVFLRYLLGLTDQKLALSVCRHFQRIASIDGVRDLCKFYYTGLSGSFRAESEDNFSNTCLHDAARAANLYVVEYLVNTDFEVQALDCNGVTALDILEEGRIFLTFERALGPHLKNSMPDVSRQPSSNGLPLGWEMWPSNATPAFVETSTEIESTTESARMPAQLYPITFKQPRTGLYQSNVIALVERYISETEKEPYLFNPLRFLRLRNQKRTGKGEQAKRPRFDEDWYKHDVQALHHTQPLNLTTGMKEWLNQHKLVNRQRPGYSDVKSSPSPNIGSFTRAILNLLRWHHTDTLVKFSLSGDLLILCLLPLSLVARLKSWNFEQQFWLSVFALAGIHTQSWHIIDSTTLCSPIKLLRTWIRIGDIQLDHLYNYTTLSHDFVLLLLCLHRLPLYFTTTFVIGNILFYNLFVFGVAELAAGVLYFQSRVNITAGQALLDLSSLPVFISTLIVIMQLSMGFDPLVDVTGLVMSRAAAQIGIVLAISFHYFSIKTHDELFTDYDEDILELTTNRSSVTSTQTPDSVLRTFISLGILLIFTTVAGDNMINSIAHLHSERHKNQSYLDTELAVLLLVPIITKSFIVIRLVALATAQRMQTVMLRTVGLSVGEGLLVLPIIVLIGWIFDQPVMYRFSGVQTLFLFFQWRFLGLTLYDGTLDWFKAVVLIGMYVVFALAAYVSPPQSDW